MKYTISDAIIELKPGADYILRGEDYSDLEWLDSSQTNQQKQKSIVRFLNLMQQKR